MTTSERISLSEWLGALRAELSEAYRAGEEEDVRFVVDGIELDFEMTSSRERGGHAGVQFWVLDAAAAGTRGSSTAQRVRLSLRAVGPDGDLLVKDHVGDTPD